MMMHRMIVIVILKTFYHSVIPQQKVIGSDFQGMAVVMLSFNGVG